MNSKIHLIGIAFKLKQIETRIKTSLQLFLYICVTFPFRTIQYLTNIFYGHVMYRTASCALPSVPTTVNVPVSPLQIQPIDVKATLSHLGSKVKVRHKWRIQDTTFFHTVRCPVGYLFVLYFIVKEQH